jgi:hypothetical protein
MTWSTALAAAICALLVFVPQLATASGERCEYDLQCFDGDVCFEGECTPEESLPTYRGADSECGRDRRCRIDRLKRRNEARRRLKILREEEMVRRELQRLRKEELESRPREKNPWNLGWRFSLPTPAGFTAGYTFAHPFRVELTYHNVNETYFSFDDATSTEFNGDVDTNFIDAGITYTVFTSGVTPYLKAGAMYGFGSYQSFTNFFGGGGSTDTVFHALNLEGGLDFFWDLTESAGGLHARVGAAFRPLIYHQARIEPGVYDEGVRNGLQSWWDETMFVDLQFIIGWGF